MSDKVALSKSGPAIQQPVDKTTGSQPAASAPAPSTEQPAAVQGDDQARDRRRRKAQDQIQPPALQTVVPESRAGRRTRDELKTNLLMGQLSPRSTPRRKAKTRELQFSVSSAVATLTPDGKRGLDAMLQQKAQIVDQKKRVDERPAAVQESLYQRVDQAYYRPFAANLRCRFVQGAHLPSDNPGVCLAMATHWAERSLRQTGAQPFSFADQLADAPKQLHQKFEQLVADQSLAGGGRIAKGLVRAGLQVVEHSTDPNQPSKKNGDPVFDNGERAEAMDRQRQLLFFAEQHRANEQQRLASAEQDVVDRQGKVAALKQELTALAGPDPSKARLQARLQKQIGGLQEAEQQIERVKAQNASAEQDRIDAPARLQALTRQSTEEWLARFNASLQPDRTYLLTFGNRGTSHVVAVRTGPALADPPAAGARFARLDVMDANLGEFHFDNTTAHGNRACCDFLKQWGDDYIVGNAYSRVRSFELKAS